MTSSSSTSTTTFRNFDLVAFSHFDFSVATFNNFNLLAFSDFGSQTFYNLDFSIAIVNKIDFAK
jgi:hypothetical protein